MNLDALSSACFVSGEKLTYKTKNPFNMELDSLCNSDIIKTLTKFYSSIPDYSDINHLPKDEFYATIKSLKTTCQDFKTKSIQEGAMNKRSRNLSSAVLTQCENHPIAMGSKFKKAKSQSCSQKLPSHARQFRNNLRLHGFVAAPSTLNYGNNFIDRMRLKRYEYELDDEFKGFQETLKYFELELGRKLPPSFEMREINDENPEKDLKSDKEIISKAEKEEKETITGRESRPKSLRKSHSLNNINNNEHLKDSRDTSVELETHFNSLLQKWVQADTLAHKDIHKLSNYFLSKPRLEAQNESKPKTNVDSTSADSFPFKRISSVGHKKKRKAKIGKTKLPDTECELSRRAESGETFNKPTPSPVHPVARPNLAATLRAEVARKKVRELKANHTSHDDFTPQSDWEVRRTPAWKSLALNEPHKEIIAMLLATRKAEQALQQRVYEQDMELMRQRVKAAPLLLEGDTYWRSNVGKLTHTCNQDSVERVCQQRKQRRKTGSKCGGEKSVGQTCNDLSSKNDNPQIIYPNKSPRLRRPKRSVGTEKESQPVGSGDDLSSVERAFL